VEHNKEKYSADLAVTFVLPALNEERHLEICLRSIQNQLLSCDILPGNISKVEIIVVDNQSTDGTAEVARKFGARVVEVPPGHPSKARNAGAAVAAGHWLAFVDADCELPRDWLQACGKHLRKQNIVAVGAVMRAPVAGASWVESSWYAISQAHVSEQPAHVRWLPSFNMLVRKIDFEAVGKFDERLITCEDCDLGYRLACRGELILEPGPQTAHHGESKTLGQLFRREAWRSHGNLRLAIARWNDWRNWISLGLPLLSTMGFVFAVVFTLLAFTESVNYWRWSLFSMTLCLLPYVRLFAQIHGAVKGTTLLRVLVVYSVYLAGRTVGLFWRCRRVERTTEDC